MTCGSIDSRLENPQSHSMIKLLRSPVLAALLLLAPAFTAAAQIQIHPLPEHPPAQVLPLGAHALNVQDAGAWLDRKASAALKQPGVDGAAVVVVKDGQILLSRGYGLADPASGLKVDPAHTLFPLGAISDAVTATAVMQQVAQRHLDLDADINRYLDFHVPSFAGRPLTLRDLLTGASGFDAVQRVALEENTAATGSSERFARWIKQALPPRVRTAGDVPAASDYAVALAGYIVQRISGQPFAAYVKQHVFNVLGMDHASFELPLPESLAPLAGAAFPIQRAAPAQGLVASAVDMAHFMIAQLQNGHDGRAQILDFDTAKAMHAYARSFAPGLPKAGLGFIHVDRRSQRLLEQRGELPGFHSAMVLLPQENVGIFVAVAGRSEGGLIEMATEGFTRRYFPPLPQQKRPTLDTARAHGKRLVGRYLSSRRPVDSWRSLGNLWRQWPIVMASDGTLMTPMFPDASGRARRWREVQPFVWEDVDGSGRLGTRLEQDAVRWVSADAVMPGEAFVPVPPQNRLLWNLVLIAAVLLMFALGAVLWLLPGVRRADRRLSASARRWAIGSRLTAFGFLLVAGGWWLALANVADGGLEPWLRLLQALAVLATVGVVSVPGNAVSAWSERGHGWRKTHATLLLLASAGALWFVFGYHPLSLGLHD